MVVRQTLFVPGTLKQNFCQSPYLIWRTRLRSPRGATSGSRAFSVPPPGGAACCASARRGSSRIDNAATAEAEQNRFLQLCIIGPLLPMLVKELTDQRRPLW